MKQDMKRIIVERPRHKHRTAYSRNKTACYQFDYCYDLIDDRPVRIGIKRHVLIYQSRDLKSQTDLLAPLIRFLRKQVGNHWNDVWSQVCRHNKGIMGDHVKEHVLQYVAVNTFIDQDGDVCDEQGYSIQHFNNFTMYVHPETGILCRISEQKRSRVKLYRNKVVKIGKNEYYKHNDIWYRVKTVSSKDFRARCELVRNEWGDLTMPGADVFGVRPFGIDVQIAYGADVLCIWKRATNKKECEKLNKIA